MKTIFIHLFFFYPLFLNLFITLVLFTLSFKIADNIIKKLHIFIFILLVSIPEHYFLNFIC